MGYVVIATSTGSSNELYHFGIPGMKWGVRRYQNKDGSLTDIGKKRYNITDESTEEDYENARKQIKKDVKKQKRIAALTAGVAAVGTAVALKKKGITFKQATSKVTKEGKECVGAIFKGLGEGVKTGLYEGPKKLGTYAFTGAAIIGGYSLMTKSIGKSVTDQIFKANNAKNIKINWLNEDDKNKDDKD